MLKFNVLLAESNKHPDGHPKALKVPVVISCVLARLMFNAAAAALHLTAVVMGRSQVLLVAVEYVSVFSPLLDGDGAETGIERWRNAFTCSNVTLSDVVGRL